MKKNLVLISASLLLMNTAFAGGIVTNTNQSAQFARILSRNASTDLDAVYYNPAGLTQMKDGFYFAFDNQSIFQNQNINSEFPLLNVHDYKGSVTVPFFPTAFAVYKMDKWAFSLGFGPNGGGGTAIYDKGLPSFEKPISAIPMSLSASGIPTTGYSANLRLEGSSAIYGTQLNATYSIGKILTVSLGARMVNASNGYNGYIKDIMVNPSNPASGNIGFDGTMKTASSVFSTLSAVSTGTAAAIAPYLPTAGGYTLPQLEAAGLLSPTQAAMLAGGLGKNYNPAMTVNQIYGAYTQQATVLAANSANTEDKNVDVKQTGMGFTPIIGVNLHFEKLNIALKYEHKTTLTLTNATKEDGTGLFPDGGKSSNDIPAIVAGGADYQIFDKLKISGSFNVYMDKNVNWYNNVYGQKRTIDKNYVELGLGLEYKLTDNFAVSAGYLNSNTGVSEAYQSDISYSNDAYTTGLGFQWNLSKKLVLDAGMMLTTYKDATKTFDASFDPLAASFGSYKETYGKDTFTFAFGIGYKIF